MQSMLKKCASLSKRTTQTKRYQLHKYKSFCLFSFLSKKTHFLSLSLRTYFLLHQTTHVISLQQSQNITHIRKLYPRFDDNSLTGTEKLCSIWLFARDASDLRLCEYITLMNRQTFISLMSHKLLLKCVVHQIKALKVNKPCMLLPTAIGCSHCRWLQSLLLVGATDANYYCSKKKTQKKAYVFLTDFHFIVKFLLTFIGRLQNLVTRRPSKELPTVLRQVQQKRRRHSVSRYVKNS